MIVHIPHRNSPFVTRIKQKSTYPTYFRFFSVRRVDNISAIYRSGNFRKLGSHRKRGYFFKMNHVQFLRMLTISIFFHFFVHDVGKMKG